MAKSRRRSLELHEDHITNGEYAQRRDALYNAASRALDAAAMYVGCECWRLARKNLVAARASYLVATEVGGEYRHEGFEVRYREVQTALEAHERADS